MHDHDQIDSGLIRRFTKSRTTKDKRKIVTSWFTTRGSTPIVAPPSSQSLETRPQIGDLFFHVVTSQTPPGEQLFLRVKGVDGRLGWWPVDTGYRRTDDYRLIVTPKTMEPSWVKESHFVKNQREVQKLVAAGASQAYVSL